MPSLSSAFPLLLRVFPLLLALLSACDRGPEPEPDPDPLPSGPQQYGTPFGQVPEPGRVVMYEVNPRVFSPGKTLNGITNRLDSIKALGVNVVWLMPIYQTGSERSVGSPYAIRDYKAIHSDFGDLDDLRALVDKAHELGMAVMLDWVANHTSWDHSWMSNKSWYVQDAAGNVIIPPGTNWQDVAELNYANAEMRAEMIKSMKYWALEANVDGFRCDYALGVPTDFWKEAIDSLRSLPNREFLFFAETDNKAFLPSGFDMLFGWPFYGKLTEIYSQNRSAKELRTTHLNEYNGLSIGQHIVRWMTNHDQNAWDGTPQAIFGSADAAFGAFVAASFISGVPLIYNGQEVGETRQLPFFEGSNVSINWNQNPARLTRYKRLMAYRMQEEAVFTGTYSDHSSADVIAFSKAKGQGGFLALINVRNREVTYVPPSQLKNTSWTDRLEEKPVNIYDSITLAPYQVLLLDK